MSVIDVRAIQHWNRRIALSRLEYQRHPSLLGAAHRSKCARLGCPTGIAAEDRRAKRKTNHEAARTGRPFASKEMSRDYVASRFS